jgi:hypothetical protein
MSQICLHLDRSVPDDLQYLSSPIAADIGRTTDDEPSRIPRTRTEHLFEGYRCRQLNGSYDEERVRIESGGLLAKKHEEESSDGDDHFKSGQGDEHDI